MDVFTDRVAVVTGASSGIGRSTALALARRGVRVVASGRSQTALESLVAEIRRLDRPASLFRADVSDPAQNEALVRFALERFGRIDIAVCNAGVYLRRPVRELALKEIERCMAVNFFGAAALIGLVLPLMLARNQGHIVAVSSMDGKKGLPPDAAYVASKFAVTGYMDVLRQELRGTNVRASTILPGRVDTPMIEHLRVPWISRKIPSERVAAAILRAVEKNRAEVIVPFAGPKLLSLVNAFSPRLADWVVWRTGISGTGDTQGRGSESGEAGREHPAHMIHSQDAR